MTKQTGLHTCFQYLTNLFSWAFSAKLNPLHHLGAISIFLLIIDSISGIYLYIFYKIDPRFSYSSVEAISSGLIGNIMRGIHRYSSAALIMTTILHAMHVVMTDRFRMFRWLAWFTGIVSLIVFIIAGISGYILVWDIKAKLVGILSGKLLSFLPIFGDAIMSTFFGTDIKHLGGLFRMLLYLHIALTILIALILWIHVMRNARPRLMPPRFVWLGITGYMIVLSVVLPARSDPEASLSSIPFEMSMDWFYFFIYPLMKVMPISWIWALLGSVLIVLILFPWLVRGEKNPVVVMDKEKCTGCERCYFDCPYEAVIMNISNDGEKKALLNENKCAGCGICVGSCSFKAIDLSIYPWQKLLDEIKEKAPEVVVLRCPFSAKPPEGGSGVFTITVPCIGDVHTNHAKEILKLNVKGLLLVACEQEDCYFREGTKWTAERYEKKRKPSLANDVDQSRIRLLQAPYVRDISDEFATFIKDLKEEKTSDKIIVRGYNKLNYIAASVVLVVPALFLYPLTNHWMAFYPQGKSAIVMSFKYRSSQSLTKAKSPIKVSLLINNRPEYSRVFYPRGLRRDSSVFVYDEINIKPEAVSINFSIEETEFPEKRTELTMSGELKPKESIIVTYDEAKKSFVFLK